MQQAGTLQRNNIADIYPLSPMQEGILFHTVSEPGDGLYMPQTALGITGPIDGDALKAAWQGAIDRHAILRSGFFWEERDEPFQIAFKRIPVAFTVLNWEGADEEEGLKALFAANRAEPFNLRRPPLLRVQWIRTGDDRSILVVCYHHIVLDGWSIRKLLDEVLLLYRRETGGGGPPLPAPRPYGDYIGWLKGRDRAASLQFWRDQLEGSPGPVRLLARQETSNFSRVHWQCPAGLQQALTAYCAASGHTLNTVLQGALALLLVRQSGRLDVTFGTTTSGRPAALAGATDMIGLFINTLPVRVSIDRGLTVGGWLDVLQARQAASMDHEHVPLSAIQGAGTSLFDTLLVVENFGVQLARGDALPFATEGIDFDERTHFPLTLWATPHPGGLTLMLGYSSDTVDKDTIAALLAAFADGLADMLASPDTSLETIVDRLAPPLAAPGLADPAPNGETAGSSRPAPLAGPRLPTPTERMLARTWAEVLKSGPLGPDANFFTLGGHSLLAARVISRLRGELSVAVPVRSLFERPVLADLAAYIDTLARPAPAKGHIEIEI